MKELMMKKRVCECCGSSDLESVFRDKTMVKTRAQIYRLESFVVICRNCGFCFNSPSPVKEELMEYYADCLSVNIAVPLAYSIETRLETLKRYAGGNFVEIGGNQSDKFHERIKGLFLSTRNIEPNLEIAAGSETIDKLEKNSVDVLAFYDVLEHVADVRDFLRACKSSLKEGGVMIVEVPNIKYYPKNLMLLSAEHLNHFSPFALERIARRCGFDLIEISHTASRPFSFLAVFKKGKIRKYSGGYNEYLDNLACLRGGVNQIDRVMLKINNLRDKIIKLKDKKIVLWCVTDFLYRFLEGYKLPQDVIVVDSDSRKKDHLSVPVYQPAEKLDFIRQSDLLVIFSPRNKTSILDWILENTGEEFNGKKLEVIGCGVYGEPLQV
ncbi:MAG: methyltransferase domain-containing protein [Patescibacteria group bacterium]|jgi:SAM-dependent methyltransferase